MEAGLLIFPIVVFFLSFFISVDFILDLGLESLDTFLFLVVFFISLFLATGLLVLVLEDVMKGFVSFFFIVPDVGTGRLGVPEPSFKIGTCFDSLSSAVSVFFTLAFSGDSFGKNCFG